MSASLSFSKPIETFGQLDVSSPGIGEKCIGDARRKLLVRLIQFDSAGLQLLAECFEILDLETDVVQHPALCRRDRAMRLCKIHVHARYVGSVVRRILRLVPFPRYSTKHFDVPIS